MLFYLRINNSQRKALPINGNLITSNLLFYYYISVITYRDGHTIIITNNYCFIYTMLYLIQK